MIFQLIPTAMLWRRLRRDTARAARGAPAAPTAIRLSENAVVGLSLNVPIALTCRGQTRECARACYAIKGTLQFLEPLRVQVANQRRLDALAVAPLQEVHVEADGLAREVARAGLDVLRINGSGDLSPGSVRLINALSRRAPWLRLWVVSRRMDLAPLIRRRPNVYLMLSADRSTPARAWRAMLRLRRRDPARVRIAWMRVSAEERVPLEARVIFREHRGAWRSPLPADPRDCPKTVPLAEGGMPHQGACLVCTRCFSDELPAAELEQRLRRADLLEGGGGR